MRVAIFDLDGTITRHDTFLPFVFGFLSRHPWRLPRLVGVVPALLRYAITRDRGALKSALMRSALGGVSRIELDKWNARFVPALVAHGTFKQALDHISAHRRAGDVLVLLSASPDLYVPTIAAQLGFTESISTGVRWRDDRLDGRLTTANRRGEEKTRCLELLRSRHAGLEISAYANALSDLEHLRRCTRGILVNGSTAARRRAAELGIRCVDWR